MYEQYTDKQIVEMLKPKLAKLGWESEFDPRMEKLISTLYKSGYIRGQLGRSFIIGEKNKHEHWVPANKDNIKVGSKVRMIDKEANNEFFCWFPINGVVGVVVKPYCCNCEVQWPEGTTSGNDSWYCNYERLEVLLCE